MVDEKIFALCETITESEIANLNGDFLSNIKEDGDRILAIAKDGEVLLMNRRGLIKNKQFREVVEELTNIAREHPNFIIDGEIIAENGEFNLLSSRAGTQNKHKIAELEKTIPILYMVFDILSLDNVDLRAKPLKERILELGKLIFSQQGEIKNRVRYCKYGTITDMLFKAKSEQLEGIVIKDMNAPYESRRSKNWLKLKLKTEKVVEFSKYETNNKGLRLSDEQDNAIQMSRIDLISRIVNEIKTKGKIAIECECLEIFDTGKMRQPVFKRIVGDA